jgi:uncharacterized protein YbjT (DUF2867 family)
MILLTGATGKTGTTAAKTLLSKGVKFRVLVRNADKAKWLKDVGVEVLIGDLADAGALGQAMAGVTKAVLTQPNTEHQLDNEKRFVDVANKAGVKHIIKMSSMESVPGTKMLVPALHVESEAYIRASGLAWTMIRPNFFMQNFLGSGASIKNAGKFSMPCGQGMTGMSDARDIGEVVAAVLTGAGHENQSYDITGPQVLTFTQAAEIFSQVLGRKIEYVDMPLDQYRAILTKVLVGEWHINAVCELIGGIAHGGLDKTTDTAKRILGREPTSLAQFITQHIGVFKA